MQKPIYLHQLPVGTEFKIKDGRTFRMLIPPKHKVITHQLRHCTMPVMDLDTRKLVSLGYFTIVEPIKK